MKHNIRINGQVKQIDCQFGTDVTDKHQNIIFDGDFIKVDFAKIRENWKDQCLFQGFPSTTMIGEVNFGNGKFEVYFHSKLNHGRPSDWLYLWELRDNRDCIEIVG